MLDYAFIIQNKVQIEQVFDPVFLAGCPVYSKEELFENGPIDVEYVFSSWGMPILTEDEIAAHLPNLKALFYAAGTVRSFARPFLNKGIRLFSSWHANAVPVAEFTVAQIVLANKGYFQTHNRYKQSWKASTSYARSFPCNYDVTVGLLGAGAIGRKVIELIKPYKMLIKVYDPFLSETEAAVLGVEKTSLEDIFANCQTISNHLANNDQTQRILHAGLFAMMKKNATFINTGRGAQVDVDGLIAAMQAEPDRTALLDVTDPEEPLPPEHPLLHMPNIFLSPHCAGSIGNEVRRMGVYMTEEYQRLLNNEPLLYEITLEMLETMA